MLVARTRTLAAARSLQQTQQLFGSHMSSSLLGKDSRALKNGDAEPPVHASSAPARLYSMRFCPFAQRAAIYLAKKGVRTEIVNINLAAKPDWYFAKNPKGTVPTFELDDKVVFESLIVPEYLDGVFPDTAIISAHPYTRARQRILVEQLSVIVGGYTGIFFALKGDKSDAEIRDAIGKCAAALDECEKLAATATTPFFAGATAGFPDYMVFPFFDRLWAMTTGVVPSLRPALAADVKQFTVTDFPGSATWPRLTRWFDAMQRLDEVEASRQPHGAQTAFLKTYIAGAPDYDIGA